MKKNISHKRITRAIYLYHKLVTLTVFSVNPPAITTSQPANPNNCGTNGCGAGKVANVRKGFYNLCYCVCNSDLTKDRDCTTGNTSYSNSIPFNIN